jgi:hypothetical protein
MLTATNVYLGETGRDIAGKPGARPEPPVVALLILTLI